MTARVTLEPVALEVCVCCVLALANGDDCECAPDTHPYPDGRPGLGEVTLGATDCDYCPDDDGADCEPSFSWRPCDLCGSRLGGDRSHATAWEEVMPNSA